MFKKIKGMSKRSIIYFRAVSKRNQIIPNNKIIKGSFNSDKFLTFGMKATKEETFNFHFMHENKILMKAKLIEYFQKYLVLTCIYL